MHAIKIMSKDEMLFLLEKFHSLEFSVRALKQNTGQEIQTFQKAVVRRLKKIEEFVETDEQGQKLQGQDSASSVSARRWNDLPGGLTAYPVISSERPCGTKHGSQRIYLETNMYDHSKRN